MVNFKDVETGPGYCETSAVTSGITLRDWFAGQAISGIIFATSSGLHTPGQKHGTTVVTGMALDAYELADAMLAARKGDK